MPQRMRFPIIVCCLFLALLAQAGPLTGVFSEELDIDNYDCIVTLLPPNNLKSTSATRITLEWDAAHGYLQSIVTPSQIAVVVASNGKTTAIGKIPITLKSGVPLQFSILRRGSLVGLVRNGELVMRGQAPKLPGEQAGAAAGPGWTIQETRIQRLEPVLFTDDFMRGKDDSGPWKTIRGEWALQSVWDDTPQSTIDRFFSAQYAQNPFAWVGVPTGAKSAFCVAGEPFWEDYTFEAAVCPSANGAVGILVNVVDEKNYLLAKWTPVSGSVEKPNLLSLIKVANGTPQVIANSPGGYLPGQWYKFTVDSTLKGVRVLIDGRERIPLSTVSPWRGKVGLQVDGARGATFDDVTVYGHSLDQDLLFEIKQSKIKEKFQTDNNGMSDWSNLKSEWMESNQLPNHHWYRRDIFTDRVWMALNVTPTPLPSGELWMTLNGDGENPKSGYRVTLILDAGTGKMTCTLYQNEKVLAKNVTDPLSTDTDHLLRFNRQGTHVWLEDDEQQILVEAKNVEPISGSRPAYRANGCFITAREILVLSHNILDYAFSDAPTDWLHEGVWMSSIRWSCEPKWSFLAGWSRGDAALWHKKRFTGDQSFQAFVGIKMEYPRERDVYANRYRDMGLTICGDGRNPRSGYAGIFAASGEAARRLLLLRNGVVVSSQALPPQLTPNIGEHHRAWFDLELVKTGAIVTFIVQIKGKELKLSYRDPEPIPGGVPAVWTTDNGISVARARFCYSSIPQPRTDAFISITEPHYPEWTNVNTPLILDFSSSYSTSGKPLTMKVVPHQVPAGSEQTATAKGASVNFTPTQPGEHWFSISASDGAVSSSAVDISLPVFDPTANKRDDSHALLLYYFDEGKGTVIHDRSPKAPAADLSIIKNDENANTPLTATWLSGQGLLLNGSSRVMTQATAGADKLLTIAQQRACTIEMWVSPDTVYPATPDPARWTSSLFTWDFYGNGKGDQRNLTVSLNTSNIIVSPRGGQFNNGNCLLQNAARNGLIHLVITWDGNMTRAYTNGQMMGERQITWPPSFAAGNLLILGNTADSKFPFFGTFYLFAIHDRCFSPDDIKRHYQAGPSAR